MDCRTCHHEHDADPAQDDGRNYSDPNYCVSRLSTMLCTAHAEIESLKQEVKNHLSDIAFAGEVERTADELLRVANLQISELMAKLREVHNGQGYRDGTGPCDCQWCAENLPPRLACGCLIVQTAQGQMGDHRDGCAQKKVHPSEIGGRGNCEMCGALVETLYLARCPSCYDKLKA